MPHESLRGVIISKISIYTVRLSTHLYTKLRTCVYRQNSAIVRRQVAGVDTWQKVLDDVGFVPQQSTDKVGHFFIGNRGFCLQVCAKLNTDYFVGILAFSVFLQLIKRKTKKNIQKLRVIKKELLLKMKSLLCFHDTVSFSRSLNNKIQIKWRRKWGTFSFIILKNTLNNYGNVWLNKCVKCEWS